MENDLVPWLRKWLDEKGWSQNQLGAAAGIKSGPMSRIMNGGRISPEVAESLAPIINLSADAILIMSGRIKAARGDWRKNPKIVELFNLFMQMDDEGQDDELATLRLRVERRKRGQNGKRSASGAKS